MQRIHGWVIREGNKRLAKAFTFAGLEYGRVRWRVDGGWYFTSVQTYPDDN